MRVFHCDHCNQSIFFENVLCENCGHKLAYLQDLKLMASLEPVLKDSNAECEAANQQARADQTRALWTTPFPGAERRSYRLCENYTKYNVCNWAIPSNDSGPLCRSCRLTRIIPDLKIAKNTEAWRRLETAKRRMIYSVLGFGLPLNDRQEDPKAGLAFQFMGDPVRGPRVLTGHDEGVITVNIDEADDIEREKRRVSMHEPYRTLLGHFRHEIGHYYWDVLIKNSPAVEGFRKLFGDERIDYNESLKKHYANGPRPDWNRFFVSDYASVHPWEDWAETWAHYLHMTDTLETAATCGLSLKPDRPNEPKMDKQPLKPAHNQQFDEIVKNWFPLTYVLNSLNRGMGLPDAYPFVLPPDAISKLRFVHETICEGGKGQRQKAEG
jgi:hypothetical protein